MKKYTFTIVFKDKSAHDSHVVKIVEDKLHFLIGEEWTYANVEDIDHIVIQEREE